MSKKKRLGRGLEALLGVGTQTENSDSTDNPELPESKATSANQSFTESPGLSAKKSDASQPSTESGLPSDKAPVAEPAGDEPAILKFNPRQTSLNRTAVRNPSGTKPSSLVGPDSAAHSQIPSIGDSLGNKSAPAQDSLPKTDSNASNDMLAGPGPEPRGVVELNVYDVDDNPFQPRREFNRSEIESLAESLKTHEQLQPILVRRAGDRYQLISGERRLRAAIHAGWSKIRAEVRDADDRLVAELAIVENLQRKDLNPIEKALSFRRYLDQHRCSQEDLAGRLKIDRSTVTNLLRLLELPAAVQKALQVGLLSNGHARSLLPLGEEHLQIEFCNRIQREGLSVRATEQLVRERIEREDGGKRKTTSKSKQKNGQILALEKELRNVLGTRTEIKPSSRGKGKIVIHYTSREEFERLREYFGGGSSRSTDAA